MVNKTKQIDTIERCLGELNALEERVNDLTGARERFDLVGLLDKLKELESTIQPLIQRASALEHAIGGITSSSSSPREDESINALEASVNELQGIINDVVDDFRSSFEAIRHKVGELSVKLNLTIGAVGNQLVPVPWGIEFTREDMPEPRHYGGARDTKEVENFLFDMEQYIWAVRAGSKDLKVLMVTMHLFGDAKVWWKIKYDDLQHERCTVTL